MAVSRTWNSLSAGQSSWVLAIPTNADQCSYIPAMCFFKKKWGKISITQKLKMADLNILQSLKWQNILHCLLSDARISHTTMNTGQKINLPLSHPKYYLIYLLQYSRLTPPPSPTHTQSLIVPFHVCEQLYLFSMKQKSLNLSPSPTGCANLSKPKAKKKK